MGYIVSRREEHLQNIDVDIKKWKDKLSNTTSPEMFNTTIIEITKRVEKVEKDVIEIKKKKYLRDVNDYKSGNVRHYNKANGTQKTRFNHFDNRESRQTNNFHEQQISIRNRNYERSTEAYKPRITKERPNRTNLGFNRTYSEAVKYPRSDQQYREYKQPYRGEKRNMHINNPNEIPLTNRFKSLENQNQDQDSFFRQDPFQHHRRRSQQIGETPGKRLRLSEEGEIEEEKEEMTRGREKRGRN
ncbi:Hypothetical predicted protein [Pelobates cultripes]|uniref:Uncharacterized protein n=1 Tax=Pelobates cultripes TaxID=61616 RepID=A0AAD1VUM1_PELCU|nr:Hypothetical predicted protein [Pelobates cultripes]CAH2252657.1 Hypothetical predicted protein [Pelobates cultripes]